MSVIEDDAPLVVAGPPEFAVNVRPERDRIVLAPCGELDIATIPVLEHEARCLWASGFQVLVLDLRGLSFVDSSGLRLLLRLDRQAHEERRSFSIIDGEGPVRDLLALTRMRDRFHHVER